MKIIFLILTFLFLEPAFAQNKIIDFNPAQIKFSFLSADGSFWYDCIHTKNSQPHSWTAQCGGHEFNMHLFMDQYHHTDETTYEFHYWADEVSLLKENHTQSTWLTVDKMAKAKHIIAYLGFQSDASQLRMEVDLKN